MAKALVVDDEQAITTLLKYNLEKAGYEVKTVNNGNDALDEGLTGKYDFIILDLMLPGIDGIEVTKRIRQEKITTYILILTAKDDEYDKIIGLELGADDYLTKPFSPREIVARLKAVKRRVEHYSDNSEKDSKNKYYFGDYMVNLDSYELRDKNNNLIKLTPKEFELLVYFLRKKGRVLGREELLNNVWGFDYIGQTRMVDMHVSHLREKIEENPKKPIFLKTVRGFGYRFEDE